MQTYYLSTNKQYSLTIHTFEVEHPVAVVHIVHGVEEHQDGYEPLARFLNQNGFCVITSDIGETTRGSRHISHFKDHDGYLDLLSDQIQIRDFAARAYPDCPVFLLAHSTGSILGHVLLKFQAPAYEKAVFSSYSCYSCITKFALFCASVICKRRGPTYRSAFLQKISYKVFRQNFYIPPNDIDWICYNPDSFQPGVENPNYNIAFTVAGFRDLFRLVELMHYHKNYHNVNPDMPLLFLYGANDPCVGGKKGSNRSRNVLRKAGYQNISSICYPDAGHDILNQSYKDTVYQDILSFLQEK